MGRMANSSISMVSQLAHKECKVEVAAPWSGGQGWDPTGVAHLLVKTLSLIKNSFSLCLPSLCIPAVHILPLLPLAKCAPSHTFQNPDILDRTP
jgi:hypothetical protein